MCGPGTQPLSGRRGTWTWVYLTWDPHALVPGSTVLVLGTVVTPPPGPKLTTCSLPEAARPVTSCMWLIPERTQQHVSYLFCNSISFWAVPLPFFHFLILPMSITILKFVVLIVLQEASKCPSLAKEWQWLWSKAPVNLVASKQSSMVGTQGESTWKGRSASSLLYNYSLHCIGRTRLNSGWPWAKNAKTQAFFWLGY